MLDAVGLSAEQQAVYLALLETSPATAAQLATACPEPGSARRSPRWRRPG
jgi:sugar-specific transcriptional regulator TrmB